MNTLFNGDVHAGLSGLELEEEMFDLGDGISLSKSYAHLMAHFIMAFKPAPPGSHHPGPWKAASGGFSFNINFQLGIADGMATVGSITWVKERWQVTHKLISESAEFSLAVQAIDSGQFVQNSALTLVSLWGALEALFSPSTSELKFRVSSLIAAYLEPSGNERANLQKEIAKLYDKRSAAAHGKPRHESEDLLGSFNLLRRVLMTMIDSGKVPTKEDLEGILFGVSKGKELL